MGMTSSEIPAMATWGCVYVLALDEIASASSSVLVFMY